MQESERCKVCFANGRNMQHGVLHRQAGVHEEAIGNQSIDSRQSGTIIMWTRPCRAIARVWEALNMRGSRAWL